MTLVQAISGTWTAIGLAAQQFRCYDLGVALPKTGTAVAHFPQLVASWHSLQKKAIQEAKVSMRAHKAGKRSGAIRGSSGVLQLGLQCEYA
jgi:hypothetical protein